MKVSDYLEKYVIDIAVKGYRYDHEKEMVVADINFSQEEKNKIYSQKESFGYSSNSEIDEAINAILHKSNTGTPFDHLYLSQLSPGSRITIVGDDGRAIVLLYNEGLSFFVLKDELNVLQPSDIVELLGGSFFVNRGAIFRVKRNGNYYPSDNHAFRLNCINKLICLFPYYTINVSSKPEIKWAKTKKKIYAWSAAQLSESDTVVFPLREFTDNPSAMFLIDLVANTFSINPDCDTNIYSQHKINWLEKVSMAADIGKSKIIHWKTIIKALPGTPGRLRFKAGMEYVWIDQRIKLNI